MHIRHKKYNMIETLPPQPSIRGFLNEFDILLAHFRRFLGGISSDISDYL